MENMLASMTGFGRAQGDVEGVRWVWEARSVNGRGLEVRFRLPPGLEAMEPALREAAGAALRRGNVNANLTARREETAARGAPDPAMIDLVVRLATELRERLPGAPPIRAEALLALPGVWRSAASAEAEAEHSAVVRAAVAAGFTEALAGLTTARRAEGGRLLVVLSGLLDEIAALRARAADEAAGQPAAQQARLAESVRALLQGGEVAPDRMAQEVALLAAKSDVREELDRLGAHIAAARALLSEGVGVGRRLDFLTQEFNREANTLCSKSATVALTATGLKLKAAIEQLREQVANIE